MTISSYLSQAKSNPKALFDATLAQAKKLNESNPAVLRREDQSIQSSQEHAFAKPLAGLPIVIKDNILLEGTVSGSGSKMMEGYVAPYSATVVRRLQEAGAIIVGKGTMDEFAMGTTGENSPYPLPHNPAAPGRVPGGSSSGPSVAVASGMVPAALGSDTGGSVRAPASFCDIVGLRVTYGAISRYGVQAMASSFDQVGPMATCVEDVQTIFEVIRGHDPLDATTVDHTRDTSAPSIAGLRIGLPKQYFPDSLDPRIKTIIMDAVQRLVDQGAVIVELDIPLLDTGVAVYYTLCPAEVSSNLARFDGLKFGHQQDTHDAASHMEYLAQVRAQAFGDEPLRRTLLGAHVLSSAEYEGQYVKAMDIRAVVTKQLKDHFANDIDVIVSPTFPLLPWKMGEKVNDPLAMYLADMYTVIANIAGMPAISVPAGYADDEGQKVPVGLQIMADHWREYALFEVGKAVESRK